MGCTEAEIATAFAARDAGRPGPNDRSADLWVLPENEPALAAFLAMETQWHRGGWDGRLLGLRLAALREVINEQAPADPRAVWRDVRRMERAVLDALDKAGDPPAGNAEENA